MTPPDVTQVPWRDVLKLVYLVAVDLLLLGTLFWIVTAPFWLTAIVLLGWGRCPC